MDPGAECCELCRYSCGFEDDHGEFALKCQRYAPRPSTNEAYFWPIVDRTDWCGEFAHLQKR